MRLWVIGRVVGTLSSVLFVVWASDLEAQNLVQNPGFTSGLGGWTPLTSTDYTVGWDGVEGTALRGL